MKAPYRPWHAIISHMPRCVEVCTYPKDAKYDEEYDLEEMPIPVVRNLEQYKLPTAVWIHSLSASSDAM